MKLFVNYYSGVFCLKNVHSLCSKNIEEFLYYLYITRNSYLCFTIASCQNFCMVPYVYFSVLAGIIQCFYNFFGWYLDIPNHCYIMKQLNAAIYNLKYRYSCKFWQEWFLQYFFLNCFLFFWLAVAKLNFGAWDYLSSIEDGTYNILDLFHFLYLPKK